MLNGGIIARRAAVEQRRRIVIFLSMAGLKHELLELSAVEQRLALRSERDLCHAAYSARLLLGGVADFVFPARPELWRGPSGEAYKVSKSETKNRLLAYVDSSRDLESYARRAFRGELEGLMRWVGRGPHGMQTPQEADVAYTRLLSVLAVIADAYRSFGRLGQDI